MAVVEVTQHANIRALVTIPASVKLTMCQPTFHVTELAAQVSKRNYDIGEGFSAYSLQNILTAINLCLTTNGGCGNGSANLCTYVGPAKVKCSCAPGYFSPTGKNCLLDHSFE
jgi:hypothetical protein